MLSDPYQHNISSNAYLQEHSCRARSQSILANAERMDKSAAIERDRRLIRDLSEFYGRSPSKLAADAGMAASTLSRPLQDDWDKRLSVATIEKLEKTYPEFFQRDEDRFDGGRAYLPVPVLPSFAGMGGGGTGEGDRETALLPRALIEDDLRASPADLLLIDVRGTSMEPDFKQGDQILVDQRDRNPAQPGPFALWDGDAYVVKFVERVPMQAGSYRVFSADDRFSGFEFSDQDESIRIMGRPVWFARRL